jgi:hypothetical protein
MAMLFVIRKKWFRALTQLGQYNLQAAQPTFRRKRWPKGRILVVESLT